MACKYTYKGITYNSKEEFINQVINPQFLGKSNNTLPFIKSNNTIDDDFFIKDEFTVTKELQNIRTNNWDGSINKELEKLKNELNQLPVGSRFNTSAYTNPTPTNLEDVLNKITLSESNKVLLEKIKPLIKNIKIEYVDKFILANSGAVYSDKYNTIRINKSEKNIPLEELLMHELLHAATFRKISYFETNTKGLSEKELLALNELENIRKVLKEASDKYWDNKPRYARSVNPLEGYRTDSIHEIISYAFTNKEFRDAIAKIPYKGNKSILDKLVELIANIFGVKQDTILNALLANTEILLENNEVKSIPTKTRRILEVQSDLFQKGRDKEFLVDNYKHTPGDRNFNVTYEGKEYKVGTMGGMQRVVIYKTLEGQVHYENPKQDWLTQEEIPQGLKDIVSNKFNSLKQEVLTQNKSNKENQFLQLLNKDNNWVTFFVKSIIQDSAKKGYEKVLFPSGNTASKVEGHTTLEEFKKQKEDRIKQLEKDKTTLSPIEDKMSSKVMFYNRIKVFNLKKSDGYLKDGFAIYTDKVSEMIDKSLVTNDITSNPSGVEFTYINLNKEEQKEFTYSIEDQEKRIDSEINQLKKELERIEREGFAALSKIANFYETIISNILKKQGFNPKRITDEFGNEWYEVEITPKSKEKIFLSTVSPAAKVLDSNQLEAFRRLQNSHFVSKTSYPFTGTGNTQKMYSIPAKKTGEIFTKDYAKKRTLDEMIRERNWDWIRTRDTEGAILIELGDFKDDNLKAFDSMESDTQSSPASTITQDRVMKFLYNIGFTDIRGVDTLTHNGEEIEGNAYVDMINGVMQIVDGKEDVSFPEEAMHILVELIQMSDPTLFRVLEKDVVNYDLYRKVVNDPAYLTNKHYLTPSGSPDYAKLKKEAIAKILAEYLIFDTENTEESRKKLLKVNNWWTDIINWVKRVFGKYSNPFKEALAKINEDDTSFGLFSDINENDNLFLSATRKSEDRRDIEYAATKNTYSDIKDRAINSGISKIDEKYYKDGKEWDGKRVSDITSKFYAELFKNKPMDETLRPFYDRMAQDGTFIHALFEDSIRSHINSDTGLLRDKPGTLNKALASNNVEVKMQAEIHRFVRNFLSGFPEGTRFLSETIVHDPKNNELGTVDFIAIEPVKEGNVVTGSKIDIYDWKSILFQTLEGAKDYKKEGINLQLNEYKRILKDVYTITSFGKIRAIPINRVYGKANKAGIKPLLGIEIGAADPEKVTDKYLRPIISDEESTGNAQKDKAILTLKGIYQSFVDQLKKGKLTDRRILDDIDDAMYELRVSNSIKGLTIYLKDLKGKIDLLNKDIDKNTSTDKKVINALLSDLSLYETMFNSIKEVRFLSDDDSLSEKEQNILTFTISKVENSVDNLKIKRQELMNTLAENDGVFGLLAPEEIVRNVTGLFRAMGNQDVATIRYLYELTRKSYTRIDFETDEELNKIKALKYRFDEYIKNSGLSHKEAIGKLVNFEKGTLHSKIDTDFFEKRKEVFDSRNEKNIKAFIKDNYNYHDYLDWYNAELKKNIDFWKTLRYSEDDEENRKILISKRVAFQKNYDIEKHVLTAFNPYNKMIWNKNIKEEQWLSKEYKEIKDNDDLRDIYNFFINKNKQLFDIGAIEEWKTYNFLPNVRKTYADIFSFEDKNWMEKIKDTSFNTLKNWKKSLTVEDYELNYSDKRDPITGERTGERFIPFLSFIPAEEKSFDLFTIYGLMSKEIAKEKYLKENDEIIRSLVHIEKAKQNFETTKWGNIATKGGKPIKPDTLKGQNVPLLEKHVKAVVEGRALQVDNDNVITFGLRNAWNKSPAGKLYKFDTNPDTYSPTSISTTKALMWLNNFHQKRILGLNLSSAASNLFGGTFSSNKLYKKYVSNGDLNNAWLQMTSVAFYQNDDMKKRAALVDYFLPILNNREAHKAGQMSVNGAVKVLSQEWLMSPMRKTDEVVQLNIFLALLENTGLVNGEIVNLREQAANETGYYDRFTKDGKIQTKENRDAIEKKFEKRLKELKEKESLVKKVVFKTEMFAGKERTIVEIPGVDRHSNTVDNLRNISQTMSKDALGAMDEFDVAGYRYNIYWRLFMTFKNWIPRMADVRFGEFHYSQSHHSHEYGRFRMFWRSFSVNYMASAAKLLPIVGRAFKDVSRESIIQRAIDVYNEKVNISKQLEQYNEETFITEGEFVDMYLKGVDASFAEFRTLSLMMLLLVTGIMKGDDDDSSEEKSFKALIRRQVDKMGDEVGFFYSPKSMIDIAGQTAPLVGMIRDSYNLFNNVSKEMFGLTMDELGYHDFGQDLQEKAKPMKYTFKVLPVLKEILTYMPILDAEMAKEWGIKIQNKNGF